MYKVLKVSGLKDAQIWIKKTESLLFYSESAPEEFLRRAALRREQAAVSAPLRLLLIDFLAEARKPPPEAPSRNADRASA